MTPRYSPTQDPGIFKHATSGKFYLRETISTDIDKSERVERSLKTRAWDIAKDRAKAIRIKMVRGEKMAQGMRPTFNESFDLVEKLQSTQADKTYEQAVGQIKHLRPWFREHCPYLTGPCLPAYRDGFEKQFEEVWADYKLAQAEIDRVKREEAARSGKKSKKRNRQLGHDRRYLVMALKRAQRRGWITREFTKDDFPLNEVTEPIGKYIEDADVKALLRAAKRHEELFLQVSLAVFMGFRISEVLHLSKEEISLKKREIDLDPHRVKTRKRRQVPVPVPDEVFPLLDAAYHRSEGRYVFPRRFTNVEGQPVDWDQPQDDNRYHWDKVRVAAGVEARFHDLRHSCITNLLKKGVPDYAVRKFCGVSEETMRRIYAHIEGEMREKFRDAFKGRFYEQNG